MCVVVVFTLPIKEIESVDPLKMNSDANSSQTVNAAADPHPTTRLSSADIIGATTQSLNVKQQVRDCAGASSLSVHIFLNVCRA